MSNNLQIHMYASLRNVTALQYFYQWNKNQNWIEFGLAFYLYWIKATGCFWVLYMCPGTYNDHALLHYATQHQRILCVTICMLRNQNKHETKRW